MRVCRALNPGLRIYEMSRGEKYSFRVEQSSVASLERPWEELYARKKYILFMSLIRYIVRLMIYYERGCLNSSPVTDGWINK